MDLFVRLAADIALIGLVIVVAPIILWNLRGRWWANVPVLIMAGLTSLVIGKVMSLLYQPAVARPFLELGVTPGASYIDNPGFPSDHALFATTLVVAFYAITRHKRATVLLGTVVVMMGISRVLALVHTPVDVVAGIVAGLLGAFWYIKLTK